MLEGTFIQIMVSRIQALFTIKTHKRSEIDTGKAGNGYWVDQCSPEANLDLNSSAHTFPFYPMYLMHHVTGLSVGSTIQRFFKSIILKSRSSWHQFLKKIHGFAQVCDLHLPCTMCSSTTPMGQVWEVHAEHVCQVTIFSKVRKLWEGEPALSIDC